MPADAGLEVETVGIVAELQHLGQRAIHRLRQQLDDLLQRRAEIVLRQRDGADGRQRLLLRQAEGHFLRGAVVLGQVARHDDKALRLAIGVGHQADHLVPHREAAGAALDRCR